MTCSWWGVMIGQCPWCIVRQQQFALNDNSSYIPGLISIKLHRNVAWLTLYLINWNSSVPVKRMPSMGVILKIYFELLMNRKAYWLKNLLWSIEGTLYNRWNPVRYVISRWLALTALLPFYNIQLTLVISNSLISYNRLSRSENMVPLITQTNRQQNIVEKRRNCSLGAISPLFHNILNISLTWESN